MKRWIAIGLLIVAGWIGMPGTASAGSLSELEVAVEEYYVWGEISDADVKVTLDDLIVKAQAALGDLEVENAYRGSFIDVVNAFTDAGISSAAAEHLIELAQP